ncbi:OR8S1 protein, partial [Crocuta crocuta]
MLMAWSLDFGDVHAMPYFSCELPSLFPLPCSDFSVNFAVLVRSAIVHALWTILLILFSYACIIATTLRISPTSGRSKAFSTGSSDLTLVISYGSGFLCCLVLTSGYPVEAVFSMQYSVVTPLVNPFLYSLKNKEVKATLKRMLQKDL